LISQRSLHIPEADEPHATFLENALAKARHASRASGLPALADDSGLCVESLSGEPGVHSAYYAGRDGDREERDARNNERLLSELGQERKAYYCCVLVMRRDPHWRRRNTWRDLVRAPRMNGFGYDPLFYLNELENQRAGPRPKEPHQPSQYRVAQAARVAE
jgi:XTP/dITP diphosphohydrolase